MATRRTTKRTTTKATSTKDTKGWKQPKGLPLGIQRAAAIGGGRYVTVGVNVWQGREIWRVGKAFLKDGALIPMGKGAGTIPTRLVDGSDGIQWVTSTLLDLQAKRDAILEHYRLNADGADLDSGSDQDDDAPVTFG